MYSGRNFLQRGKGGRGRMGNNNFRRESCCDGNRRRFRMFNDFFSCFRKRYYQNDGTVIVEKITEKEELEKQAEMLKRQLEHIENLLKEKNN